jgi:hypothetical protein
MATLFYTRLVLQASFYLTPAYRIGYDSVCTVIDAAWANVCEVNYAG